MAPAIISAASIIEWHLSIWLFQCLSYAGDSCQCHPHFPVVQLIGLQYSVLSTAKSQLYSYLQPTSGQTDGLENGGHVHANSYLWRNVDKSSGQSLAASNLLTQFQAEPGQLAMSNINDNISAIIYREETEQINNISLWVFWRP